MVRLHGDFNGVFGDLLCLSHGDTALDEHGHPVALVAGMRATAFEPDVEDGQPVDLVASGVVEPAPEWLACRGARWVLRMDEQGVRHEPKPPP